MDAIDIKNKSIKKAGLNSNCLKMIAIIAMTIDHVTCVVFPDFPKDWRILCLHIIGRLAAPILWFFIAEGYRHTRSVKKYAARLFVFAIISHFAYNFAFGIPFIPFQTTVFNQTSVIWPLAWALVGLWVCDNLRFKQWQKTVLVIGICVITFCADWSCIAVMAILNIACNHGNFKKQMQEMMIYVALYALVYIVFIDAVYGVLQLFTALTIPLLKLYNGERGKLTGMKWFFYAYYPLHLIICGLIRLALHGNISVLIGG